MEVICLEDEGLYKIADELYNRLMKNHKQDKWISGDEAMKMMRITSKTTLLKFRNEGKIRFSQPEKKVILYDTQSILDFLDKNAS